MKERGTLTESMFYVLMSFLRGQMCGIEITEFVERAASAAIRLRTRAGPPFGRNWRG